MPAAKGSARTPLGPKMFVTRLVEKIDNNRNIKKNGNVDVEDIINGSYENGFL
jgi:hypothetical protein